MANIIEKVQKPTLVLAHNKTLAGQLYSEFKEFFPRQQRRVFCILLHLTLKILMFSPFGAFFVWKKIAKMD